MKVSPLSPKHNQDIECLRCGAFNIPENHVCGRCGASLPLIYTEEGEVFSWTKDPHSDAVMNQGAIRRTRSKYSVGWLLRFSVILFAVLFAIWILRHR
jgi:uncharacterized OB-fold protein